MVNYLFLGDVHGKFGQFKTLIEKSNVDKIVCVGDLGIGFKYLNENGEIKNSANPPYDLMVKKNVFFIRGNHDNPEVCKKHTQWIKDGHTEEVNGIKIMYIGGAWSIDFAYRREGFSWWKDEELSMQEFDELIGKYLEYKPDLVVTHDFPESAIHEIFIKGTHKPLYRSRTGQALDAMWKSHAPKIWVGGHWHTSTEKTINGTKFIVLEELGTLTLTV